MQVSLAFCQLETDLYGNICQGRRHGGNYFCCMPVRHQALVYADRPVYLGSQRLSNRTIALPHEASIGVLSELSRAKCTLTHHMGGFLLTHTPQRGIAATRTPDPVQSGACLCAPSPLRFAEVSIARRGSGKGVYLGLIFVTSGMISPTRPLSVLPVSRGYFMSSLIFLNPTARVLPSYS